MNREREAEREAEHTVQRVAEQGKWSTSHPLMMSKAAR
jgi:hypothetical protein